MVRSILRDQLRVGADFRDGAVFQHNDLRGGGGAGEAVRDIKGQLAFPQTVEL